MGGLIGELLPLALGVAVSPVPVGAAVLILLGDRPRNSALGFLVGWIVGIVVAVTVFTLLAALIPQPDPDSPQPVIGVIKVALGLLMLIGAVVLWRRRPHDGIPPAAPRWMQMMSRMNGVRGLVLGFVLAVLNPVDTLMAIAGGVLLGTTATSTDQVVVGIIVFTLIGASTVAIPVVAYLVAPTAMGTRLQKLREWLVRYNSTITIVLIIVVGFVLLGKGIGDF